MIQRYLALTGFWVCSCLVLVDARDVLAQPAGSRAKDEAAVRQAGKDYLAAIERGDNKALADFWTADGTFTDQTGRTVKVRDLPALDADRTRGTGLRLAGANVTVRFVTDNVVIEEGEFNVPAVDGGASAKSRYMALWVRDGGRWKLDSVRETSIEPEANPDQLASLGVFVGEWSGEENEISIRVSAKWDANKKFLTRRITMAAGKASLVGNQTIGWDPLTRQIRSWMFCDDGSYTEGLWSMEGNAWMVLSSRVLPDGRISEATQVYKIPNKDTIVWKLIRCSIDDQPADDLEVVLKRSTVK